MIKNRSTLESQFPHSEHALDILEAGLNAAICLKTLCYHCTVLDLEKFSR